MGRVKVQYLGGYPDCPHSFNTIIEKVNDDIVFYSYLMSKKEQFKINKNDILNIEYERGSLRTNIKKLIVLRIRYQNSQIELLLNGGLFAEREYSNLMALVYSNNSQQLQSNISCEKFYNQTWFIVILLVFFAPLGIYLLWKNKKGNAIMRVLMTGLFSIVFLVEGVAWISKIANSGTVTNGTATVASQTTNGQTSTSSNSTATADATKPTASTQPAKEKTWVDVTKFEGNGIKNTEKFNIDSDEWRIVWSTQPGDSGKQNFQIYVNDKDGELSDVAANIIGQGNDTSYMNKSGQYSLKIVSGQPYTITIQEKK